MKKLLGIFLFAFSLFFCLPVNAHTTLKVENSSLKHSFDYVIENIGETSATPDYGQINDYVNVLAQIIMFLPLIICFICFLIKLPKLLKLDVRTKHCKLFFWLDLHIFLFVMSASFDAIGTEAQYFAYISLGLMIITIFTCLVEKLKYRAKVNSKLCLLITFSCVEGIIFLTNDSLPIYDSISVGCCIFSILLVIVTIYRLIKLTKPYEDVENIVIKKAYPKGKYLPNGYVSIKELIISLTFYILILTSLGLLIHFTTNNIGLIILYSFLSVLIIFGYVYLKELYNLRMFLQFNKNNDLELFKNSFRSFENNSRINPEYKNYYSALYASVLILFNYDEYKAIMDSLFISTIDVYRMNIELIKINIFMSLAEFIEEKDTILAKYPKKKNVKKKILEFEKMLLAINDLDYICDVDNTYPINTKNSHTNACNSFIRFCYYINKNNYDKAREVKMIFNEKYQEFTELNKRINLVEL